MESLSEKVERKFVDQIVVDDYEILTDTGWKDIKSIGKTIKYQIYEVATANHQLKCADDHIVFDENMNERFVKDLQIGDLIQTDLGNEEVQHVRAFDDYDNMYDIELGDDSDHRYYTNGILSHNSTIYCIYSLWLATFFPEKKIMLLANKAATALELLGRIITGYEYLPKWLKAAATVVNKGELSFANMSSIRAFASSSDAARGFACNVVICDEFAFLQKNIADKLFTSMYPTISSSKNGKFIIVSTPNGTDNLYYDIWNQANSKEVGQNLEGWKAFSMYWWQVPGHDQAWKEKQIAAIGSRRFAQEFNNEFITNSSIRKLIPDEVLEQYRIKLSEYKLRGIVPKKQRIISQNEDELYEFDMWHEFDPKKTYVASADISEGVGGDSSVLYIWDVTDLANIKMCAKFSSNTVSVVQFAFICKRILSLYCNPWLFAERNGVSSGMLDSLKITYGYRNIASENKKGEVGVYSHVQVKGKACLWTRDMLCTQGFGFTIYDKDLLDEFGIFVKKETKGMHLVYQALPGPNSHDDHVMAFIWMCFALSNELVEKYFIVCQRFTTEMEQIYAKILLPTQDYSSMLVKEVTEDPLYKDFLDFKEDLKAKLGNALANEQLEDENDPMFQAFQKDTNDEYFGDVDDGDCWTHTGAFSSPMQQSFQRNPFANRQNPLNPNNVQPSFYIG